MADALTFMPHMQRREIIRLVAGAALGWPLAARAQQSDRMRRVGVLMAYAENNSEGQTFVEAFRQGLQNLGWREGSNIAFDYRWASGDVEKMQTLAGELVTAQADAILSHSTTTTAALLKHTSEIPVIFANVTDPVGSGFVASLARPGRNSTGFINMEASMSGKWLGLLRDISPGIRRVAFLFSPETAPYFAYYIEPFKAAAASLAMVATPAPVRDLSDLGSTIAANAREPNGGMIVMTDNFTTTNRAEIIRLAASHRLPTIYPYRFFAQQGGLMSYGSDISDNFGRAASYVDRVLHGAKPSELPVQAPVKFDLVINLKTAAALGLTVPTSMQLLADEVIE
jgi:putative ABC transport system substrate-binding protein